ncbi:MAG: CHAP domain-containing protein [Eubacterium sp.]|nr:CHAP domain-containing protein [Eubacterium sp.]
MNKKKTLVILPIVIVLTIIMSLMAPVMASASASDTDDYKPRLTAPKSSIAYYNSKLNVYAQTGTPMPNCVAYAYGRIYEMNGEKPLITHGSAGDWYGMNKRNGYYPYGQKPKVGAVACWSGHVAIVEKVHKDGSITVSESHWGGRYFNTKRYKNVKSHYGQRFQGYIYAYNNGVTKALKKKLLKAKPEMNTQYKQNTAVSPDDASEFTITNLDRTVEASKNSSLLYSGFIN